MRRNGAKRKCRVCIRRGTIPLLLGKMELPMMTDSPLKTSEESWIIYQQPMNETMFACTETRASRDKIPGKSKPRRTESLFSRHLSITGALSEAEL